jgi:ribosomal protein S27E
MRVRHYARGKFYTIDCPEGTRVERRADGSGRHDRLIVPFRGEELRLPADPPDLLPMLAESGNFGVSLVGEPEPEARLAGVACPGCGEPDASWLRFDDATEAVHCDRCGADFGLAARPIPTSGVARG